MSTVPVHCRRAKANSKKNKKIKTNITNNKAIADDSKGINTQARG